MCRQHVTAVSPSDSVQSTVNIPLVAPFLNYLQEFAMPKPLPDGRTESPGVVRIYLASMMILAAFYLCSAVVSVILNSVAALLRAAGILGQPSDGQ